MLSKLRSYSGDPPVWLELPRELLFTGPFALAMGLHGLPHLRVYCPNNGDEILIGTRLSSTKSPSVLTSQLAVSTAIGSRLDIVASTHEIFEPLFIIEQHTVTQHPVVVVGEHVVGWAFWP